MVESQDGYYWIALVNAELNLQVPGHCRLLLLLLLLLLLPSHCESGQSVRQLIKSCVFDSRYFHNLKGLGQERDPPSLVRTTGYLLDREVLDLFKKFDNRLDVAKR